MIESEKKIEKLLSAEVKKLGGWCIKFLPFLVAGLPDRLCFLPDGILLIVEVKTTGQKTSAIQKVVHKKFNKIGFPVHVIDTSEGVRNLLKDYENRRH